MASILFIVSYLWIHEKILYQGIKKYYGVGEKRKKEGKKTSKKN